MGKSTCPHCQDKGQRKVAVSWRPNPRDKVGYLPPVIEYETYRCECSGGPVICRRCNVPMEKGQAMGQTYTTGAPDFPGDKEGITISAGGPGRVIQCLKCPECGWSVKT